MLCRPPAASLVLLTAVVVGQENPDECESMDGLSRHDCDKNEILDSCDIASGALTDADGDGVPDECQRRFRRGDGDGNGAVEISDPIYTLAYLFLGTVSPGCFDALDYDDSGILDLSDVIANLMIQMLAGPPPPAPGHFACGHDPTIDNLDCTFYPLHSCSR